MIDLTSTEATFSPAQIRDLVREYIDGTRAYCDPPTWFSGTTEEYHRLVRHLMVDLLRTIEVSEAASSCRRKH